MDAQPTATLSDVTPTGSQTQVITPVGKKMTGDFVDAPFLPDEDQPLVPRPRTRNRAPARMHVMRPRRQFSYLTGRVRGAVLESTVRSLKDTVSELKRTVARLERAVAELKARKCVCQPRAA